MTMQTRGSSVPSSQKPQLNGNSNTQGNGSGNSDISGSSPLLNQAPLASPGETKNAENNTKKGWSLFWSRLGKWWSRLRWKAKFLAKAYGGSLLITSISFPIFASAVTVGLFLAPHFAIPVLYLEHIDPNWYAPIYGFIVSLLSLLFFSALRIHFATAKGANMSVYETLKNRQSELKARLGNINAPHHMHNGNPTRQTQYTTNMTTLTESFFEKDASKSKYQKEALRKIYEAYCDLDYCLLHNHSGTEWAFETGYTNAWRIVHRTYEALIGVATVQEVISEVIHDVRSIQNSPLTDSTTLIRKMLQGVKDLAPDALPYFEELRSDKNYTDLFDSPATNQHNASPWNPWQIFFQKQPSAPPTRSPEIAREAIRQVKHTLNLYQDSLRETLVRLRNHILICIALTGFVTYFLVCSLILWKTSADSISAATIYYMIATITGLFVRFYNESNNKNASEDYGLFFARLMATPLLSGLAGVGGVLVSATVYSLGATKPSLSAFNTIFSYPINLDYLIAAAIFGSAPNLIIGTLQQRSQKYSTDLQNSKGEGSNKDD
jgi:hypothetical protein